MSMVFSKSKLLLTFAIFTSNVYMYNAKTTTNNNVVNCENDIKKYISYNPIRGIDKEFIHTIFFEKTITEMKTYYARLYFSDVLKFINLDEDVDSPSKFCLLNFPLGDGCLFGLKKSKYKVCIDNMINIGLRVNLLDNMDQRDTRTNFEHLYLFHKKKDLQHKGLKSVLVYMDYISTRIESFKHVRTPKGYCEGHTDSLVIQCRRSLLKDFGYSVYLTDIQCARTAMINKKKTGMKNNYGYLFYIELRDRIQGVKGGYERLNQFCKNKGIECLNQLSEAGYKKEFDLQSILIHTYYYIDLGICIVQDEYWTLEDIIFRFVKPSMNSLAFLYDFLFIVLESFELKVPKDDVTEFCERTVNHTLSLDVISIFK